MQGLIGGSLTIFAALHLCVKIAFLHIRSHNLKGRFIARKITKFAKTQRHLFAYNLCTFASLREKYLLFYFRCHNWKLHCTQRGRVDKRSRGLKQELLPSIYPDKIWTVVVCILINVEALQTVGAITYE